MNKAFLACAEELGLEKRFSSHGLRRTANDLLRRVAIPSKSGRRRKGRSAAMR
jgi:hypothetical protein